MKTVTYNVRVTGLLWCGCKGDTLYSFPEKPTKEQIAARAGDFQHITTACVIKNSNERSQIARYKF